MASIWVLIQLLALALALALLFHLLLCKNKHKKLPPGPKGFPIFGALHLLGKLPHRDLHRLSRRYGPIMHMKLGLVHTIVISSPAAAELFLKTHDLVFASRPRNEVLKHLIYGQKDIVFAPYGPYWRNMRKMCTLELLSNRKVDSFESMRKEEVRLLIDYLREAARSRAVIDLSLKVSSLNANITCLMIFRKKYEDEEFDERGFKVVVREALKLLSSFNLADFIPYIAMLDLQGFKRRAKSVGKVFDDFFERIIEEHQKFKNEDKTKDFVDVMLDVMGSQEAEYHIDRSSIKAIIFDMLLAAMDTSFTAIEWAISELIKHPRVMKKMQDELEKVVGLNRKVEESDLSHLEYLDMIVKETLRLHPPGPLLVPHESLEDCIVNNFHIPKGSRIIVNGWSIARDPSVWIDAEKFSPERFIGSQIDVKGRDFQLIPFGSGRRSCPGIQMGLTTVRLVLAQLVHSFDWELPNGILPAELNMTEEFGLTSPRAQNLMVIPSYRLRD